jgi:hypothetical protein
MAKDARDSHGVEVSHTALATAASGNVHQSPSWRVVKVFLDVCDAAGDAAGKIAALWEAARRVGPADRPQPDVRGAARYIARLRELRAWAGRQSRRRPLCEHCKLPTSTLSDALSPKRITLPTLLTVKLILVTCLDDEEAVMQWLKAGYRADPGSWSRSPCIRTVAASGGGGRPAGAGILRGGRAPTPPRRCALPGCGASERIWNWEPGRSGYGA